MENQNKQWEEDIKIVSEILIEEGIEEDLIGEANHNYFQDCCF